MDFVVSTKKPNAVTVTPTESIHQRSVAAHTARLTARSAWLAHTGLAAHVDPFAGSGRWLVAAAGGTGPVRTAVRSCSGRAERFVAAMTPVAAKSAPPTAIAGVHDAPRPAQRAAMPVVTVP